MSGSKKYFVYTTDNGEDFALLADESNTEQLNAQTQDFPTGGAVGSASRYQLPRNVRPRAVVYQSIDRTITRRCYALTPTIYNSAPASQPTITDAVSAQTLYIARYEPEKIRLPFGIDTGLIDGDNT